MKIGQCLGLSQLAHHVFLNDGVLKCKTDQTELIPHSLDILAKRFLRYKKKFPFVFIGERFVDLDTKPGEVSDVLLWGLREGVNDSQKRFLIDSQFVEIDLEVKNIKLEKYLTGVKELVVIRNVVSISKIEEEGLILRLEEAISESLITGQFDMVAFGFERESEKGGEIFSLSGSLICPKCLQVYKDIKEGYRKEKKSGDVVRGRGRALEPDCYFDNLLETEFLEGKIIDVLNSLAKSSLVKEVSWVNDVLKDSILISKNIEDPISSLSQLEKIICYLEASSVRKISGFYFLLELVQNLTTKTDQETLLRAISRATRNGLSFFVVSPTDFSQSIKFKKAEVAVGKKIRLAAFDFDSLGSAARESFKIRPYARIKLDLDKAQNGRNEGLLNLYGPVRSGKSEFLKEFVLENKLKAKTKINKIYFSFEGERIIYISNGNEKNFKSFLLPEVNYAEEFLLKGKIAKFYFDSRAAKLKGLAKSDFLKPETSIYKCELCSGTGFLKSELPLGYTGYKKCSVCLQTGLSDIFKDVSFFDVSYYDLLQMTFLEVFSLFEGEASLRATQEVFGNLGILNHGLNTYSFQVSKLDRISFLIAKILLFGSPDWAYLVENGSSLLDPQRFLFLKQKLDDTKISIIFDGYHAFPDASSNIGMLE